MAAHIHLREGQGQDCCGVILLCLASVNLAIALSRLGYSLPLIHRLDGHWVEQARRQYQPVELKRMADDIAQCAE